MKILIAYAGKNGTTKECVERFERAMGHVAVEAVDLNAHDVQVSEYDLCILGGCVRFGRLQKSLRRLFKTQGEELLKRPLALFFCCGLTHENEYYSEVLFPKTLRQHAFATVYFGGSLRTDGLPFVEKMLVKSIRSAIAESDIEDGEYTPAMPGILPENIEKLAADVRRKVME